MRNILKKALGWSSFVALAAAVGVGGCSSDDTAVPGGNKDAGVDSSLGIDAGNDAGADTCGNIEADIQNSFDTLAKFVAIQTWRTQNLSDEPGVQANIQKIQDALQKEIDDLNATLKKDKIQTFEWDEPNSGAQPGDPATFKVFGVKLGRGPYRVALETHLDTVPPGTAQWDAFTLKKEQRKGYRDGHETDLQDFWVGRGGIDDKGPAISTLQVLKTLARKYDGSSLLDHVTIELIFDTSEETSMSMPNYFAKFPDQAPDLAVIFDAEWCVRAEKGIERPVFSIPRDTVAATGLYVASIDTPSGPANQVPDYATAVITSDVASRAKLKDLAGKIANLYDTHSFDADFPQYPAYHRAPLKVDVDNAANPTKITLTTTVEGAQHGSKPQENRQQGANPLVSLATFLGDMVQGGTLADNDVGRMAKFVAWGWGTLVLGERQPALLQRSDDIFTSDDSQPYDLHNGTTYALTRLYTGTGSSPITLAIDIRYALKHHSVAWDGKTEGLVGGTGSKSIFQDTFTQLTNQFNARAPGHPVSFTTKTSFAPDVRLPTGPTFTRINQAYKDATGQDCPARAIGGGTDAKGQTNFLAAGALFDDHFGPPINFHGTSEGAPVRDLQTSSKILCKLLDQEIQRSPSVVKATSTESQTLASPKRNWIPEIHVLDEHH